MFTENKMKVVFQDFTDRSAVYNNIIINSTAELSPNGEVVGNPTEGACLQYVDKTANYKDTRSKANIVDRIEFNSKNK